MITRRKILIGASLGTLGIGRYVYNRGLRLPTLHLDPMALKSTFSLKGGTRATGKEIIQAPPKSQLDA